MHHDHTCAAQLIYVSKGRQPVFLNSQCADTNRAVNSSLHVFFLVRFLVALPFSLFFFLCFFFKFINLIWNLLCQLSDEDQGPWQSLPLLRFRQAKDRSRGRGGPSDLLSGARVMSRFITCCSRVMVQFWTLWFSVSDFTHPVSPCFIPWFWGHPVYVWK